jgi:hypothetical protein
MDAPEDRSGANRKALNEHMSPVLPQEQTSLLRAGTSASCQNRP